MDTEALVEEMKSKATYPGMVGVDPGWADLVCRCYLELKGLDPDIQIRQIKEKFGGLRFYAFPSEGASPDVADAIRRCIGFYERMSFMVCDECGTTKGVTTEGGWVRSMCPPCRDEKEALAARREAEFRDRVDRGVL